MESFLFTCAMEIYHRKCSPSHRVHSFKTRRRSSSKRMLPLERVIVLDSEKAVRAGTVVRLVAWVPNISESVQTVQFLAPVVFISVKGVVLIAMVLKALECRMILGRVTMKMESPVHRVSCYSPKRIYKTMPIEGLGYTDPRC